MPSPGVLRPPTSPARGEGKLLRSRKRTCARVMPSRQEAKAAKPIQTRALQITPPVEATKDRPAGSLCLLPTPSFTLPRLRGRKVGAHRQRIKKKGKRNADRRVANGRTLRGAARVQRDALAYRRSTAALAGATERHRSTPVTRFLRRYYGGAGVTRSRPSCSAASFSQTGHRAGRASIPRAAREWR
jgi:hypothetical protein